MKKLLTKRNGIILTIAAAVVTGAVFLLAPANTVQLKNSSGQVLSSHTTIQACVNSAQAGQTCEAGPGDYGFNSFYRWTKSGVDLRCPSFDCKIGAIVFEGNNNTIQGFEISSGDFKNAIRTYGNYNLILQNECHDVMEDCVWLWGTGNVVRGNYFHDIWRLASNTGGEPFDNHIDGIMTDNTFSPSSIVKTAEDLVIDGNIIVMDRDHGSNAFFMLNAGGNHAVLPKNITWSNNIFICKDAGFCPIALFGDSTTTGMKIFGNRFYNTTNKGESMVWMQNDADGCEISGNVSYGYGTVERPGNFCTKTNNQVLPFAGLPVIVWPPSDVTVPATATASPTASATPSRTATASPTASRTSTATVTPTFTATVTASPVPPIIVPTHTATATLTFTPSATNTPTPIPQINEMCVKVVWLNGINARLFEGVFSMESDPLTHGGYPVDTVVPIIAIEKNPEGTFGIINWSQFLPMRVGARQFAVVVEC